MVAGRTLTRAAFVVLMAAAPAVWYACSDGPSAPPPVPVNPRSPVADLRTAIAVQRRHTDALLLTPGVIGTAVAPLADGRAGMLILLERPGIPGLPQNLDGVPVKVQVTGRIMAFSDPTQRQRPASLGFSVGHPAITAGTIGARVVDALGRVYILSNNHVLGNSNDASIGDAEYQPGPFDGGTAADQIATLTDFQTINFSGGNNTMDAAIALSSVAVLDNATPSDDGYGMPNATMYGDADGDGMFDNRDALLGLNVQKYGRTTRLTHGQITGVNATLTVCYEVVAFTCTKSARYVDQLIISPGGFSGGGDSGSLIVTDDANLNPVALLFAGSSTVTIGNRIDLVLNRFGVRIDGAEPPPPGPLTDVSVTSVSGPSAAVQGHSSSIVVMVKNVGNQNVPVFNVTLQDTTEHVTLGTQSVPGLTAGASSALTFVWTPSTTGDHNLVASQSLADDRATNDQRSTTIPVNAPFSDVAVTSFTTPANGVTVGHTVNIGVTVTNEGNLSASSVVVTLRDTTAAAGIGTQTIATLAAGADATLFFSWNTTDATLGPHTLVATHSLADDDDTNDRLTAVVTVHPKPTDIATTAITAPRSVAQGDTAHVVVTVQNVGEVNVASSFAVELTDGTAGGAVIGSKTVAGLAIGATATVDIPWSTAGAALNGHIVIATQKLPDNKATNDAMAIAINVDAPVPPPPATDIAVTALSAPGSISQGSTASVGVTVQNVGVQNVSASFDIVLTDQTAGTTIGTQTVTGLAAGASATRNFTWTTTGATLGNHTLVATQSLVDDNAANNQRSATVTIAPQPTDVAVTGITAPPRVNQGEIAPVTVTIQNVGGQEVTAGIDVVLTDGWNGPILGTQTVPGLAVGATATRTFNWNTAGAALNGHTLFATQKLADNNGANNTIGIGITVNAPPTNDIAVSTVTAPATVTQGTTAAVGVTVQNVGGINVSASFDIVLTDQTAGVTIGTQTIPGLGVGGNTTRTFNWNTTAAALGGHTLVASHTLSDANAANNQGSVTVTVNAPSTDVAVTALTAPATVLKGSTATIGVTVQNVGGLNVGTFNVVLTDQTAGVTLGTQAVTSLAVGASATRSFSWNTGTAALGGHTLVATQTLTDDNAGNNQRSATVTVNPAPADVALASITAPGSVTQGDTAAIVVTVQNVGGQDVTTNFDVVLTDGTAGNAVLGTQTISGLALGASATRTFNWNTAGATVSGHILTATQKYPDGNSGNNAKATVVSVNAPSVHVGNLGGVADTLSGPTGTWSATVQITAHDSRHTPVNGVTVRGLWNGANPEVTCTTSDVGGAGTCTVILTGIPNATRMVSFGVTGMTLTGYTYKAFANHDPDGSSNGFSVTVKRQ